MFDPDGPADRVLVFEPEHAGHQPAYVRMLAEWLVAHGSDCKVTFAVSERLQQRLRAEDGLDLGSCPQLSVLQIGQTAAEACFHGPLHRRSFARMRLISALAGDTAAGHVISLFLDPLQLPLALGQRPAPAVTISGILFRPSVHAIYADAGRTAWRERVRDQRKLLLYRLMLRNRALSRVLSLDPYFPAFASSVLRSGGKVVELPDPVVSAPTVTDDAGIGNDLSEAVHSNGAVFTLFGALTDRKGVLQLLDAIALMPAGRVATLRVILAGRIDPEIAPAVAGRTQALAAAGPAGRCVRILDRHLTTAELAWLVGKSSVILAPYQRFVGSSGVLTWAAAERRPVIAQDYGLVGALVRDYRLGLATDTSDPAKIVTALLRLADPRQRASLAAAARWDDFLAGRTASEFAAAVLADPGRGRATRR